MASNMDGVGTFEMAKALASQKIMTCLVKTYSVNELVSFFDDENDPRTSSYRICCNEYWYYSAR